MSNIRYHYPMEVRYGDLDPQGHLNNARYLTFFEQARVHYFIHLGLFHAGQSFMDIGVIMADVRLTFHAPVHFGMPVKVGVRASRMGNKSMTVEQNIVHIETGEILASGEVVLVTFDYHNNQTIAIPQEWRAIITRFEEGK